MNEEIIRVEDDSGDRKYFTIINNNLVKDLSAIDLGVYVVLKQCLDNQNYFIDKRKFEHRLRISREQLDQSIRCLLDSKLISKI